MTNFTVRSTLAATIFSLTAAVATQPAFAAQPGASSGGAGGAASGRTIRVTYALYGHGFHVLDVAVDLRVTPDGYSIRLHDHTVGFLGFMLHTDVTSTATGRFVAGGVQPVHFESAGYSREAQRNTVLDYVDGNPSVRVLTPKETNRDPVDIAQMHGSIDTLSAMADMMHQVEQTGRCDGHALVFDGLRASQASVRTVGTQAVPADSRSTYDGSALRCDFVSQEIAGFLHDADEAKTRKPQHGSVWVAHIVAGAPALPVRIMFENPKLGLATMVLTKAEDTPASPGG